MPLPAPIAGLPGHPNPDQASQDRGKSHQQIQDGNGFDRYLQSGAKIARPPRAQDHAPTLPTRRARDGAGPLATAQSV
jgi:hypothetical protein